MIVPDFDIKTDVKVELFLPTDVTDYFILGLSELGGTDVLGGSGPFVLGISLLGGNDVLSGDTPTGYEWFAIECETNSVVSSVGGSVDNNLYFQPEAASASIQVQSWTYDPTNNPYVRAGARIRVRLDDGIVDETLFSGFLSSIDVSYLPDGPNTISFSAIDAYQRLINTRIASLDTADPIEFPLGYATPLELVSKVCDLTAFTLSAESEASLGKIYGELVEEATAARFMSDAIQVGLGIVWVDPQTEELVFRPRPSQSIIPANTYIIGNDHGTPYHLCMSNIEVSLDQSEVFNNLKVILTSDPTVFVVTQNTDLSDLYGVFSLDVNVNTTDIDELTSWADRVFSSPTSHLVKQVSTPAIDRLGDLTEAALFQPGQIIGVKYNTGNISLDEYYTIVQVNHSIDVNNWITTLELWKEV